MPDLTPDTVYFRVVYKVRPDGKHVQRDGDPFPDYSKDPRQYSPPTLTEYRSERKLLICCYMGDKVRFKGGCIVPPDGPILDLCERLLKANGYEVMRN